MSVPRQASRVAMVFALACAWSTVPAHAQLAPTGGHYGGRASDTGFSSSVNSSGGYAASIPLDLPTARGGLPLPVQVNYTERGVGAAGLGWDVPLSFIRHDLTFAYRRPIGIPGVTPQPREQVSLVLAGRRIDLVRAASGWAAQRDAPDLVVRQQEDGSWIVFDGQGWTYKFEVTAGNLFGSGLAYLSSITGPGGNRVVLSYAIERPTVSNVPNATTVELVGVQYNPDAAGCFKNSISLAYDSVRPNPLAISLIGSRAFVRLRVLKTIDVLGRASCATSAEVLRSYAFNHQSDEDTKLPRLSSVLMRGRQGTPEASTQVPIGLYGYSSASSGGQLTYQSSSLTRVTGAHLVGLTLDDDSPHPPGTFGFNTKQSLLDVTGDGRADFVIGGNIARNTPTGAGGTTQLGGVDGRADEVLGISPLEKRTTDGHRYDNRSDQVYDNMTFRQAIDMNGDGRIDIVDASEVPGTWKVYLNTPSPTDPKKIVLEPRAYSTTALLQRLRATGQWNGDDFLPLSLRSTTRDHVFRICLKWNGQRWIEFEDEDNPNPDCPIGGRFLALHQV